MSEPMTLDEAENDDLAGERWTVFSMHTKPVGVPQADGTVAYRWSSGDPADWYGVAHRQNWDLRRGGDFATEAEAVAYADELNRLDVQGPIPPEFAQRRNRLKTLAPYFGSWSYQGPPAARWPVEPGRYLVLDAGVGFHAESWEYLADDLAAVAEHLRGDETAVYRVVDLDTGEDVPFTRKIVVSVGA